MSFSTRHATTPCPSHNALPLRLAVLHSVARHAQERSGIGAYAMKMSWKSLGPNGRPQIGHLRFRVLMSVSTVSRLKQW